MTDATLEVVEGSPGSWVQVLTGTVLRAGLIGGALYFTPSGSKGSKKFGTLATQSLVASSAVTVFLLAAHAVNRRIPR